MQTPIERREERRTERTIAVIEEKAAPRNDRRGPGKQMPRREFERRSRREAVVFTRWAEATGLSQAEAAEKLGVSPRTLREWKVNWKISRLAAAPRGRPCERLDVLMRNDIIAVIRELGPETGMPTLMGIFPGIARSALWDLLSRFREIWHRENSRMATVLRWARPGAVWAIDYCHPPSIIDGLFGRLFACRDLASGEQLAWLPVEAENAATTIATLEALFLEHGLPLVIKSDNGSPLKAQEVQDYIASKGVHLLLSPPVMPEYNGAVEAGNGSMKVRTHHQSVLYGRPGLWSSDDCGPRASRQTRRPGRGVRRTRLRMRLGRSALPSPPRSGMPSLKG